ncbi:MAG: cytochrome c [Bacteroidetes bacterium]|nr:cytochrome c [Bacteroidota bacterium]
MKHHSSKKRPNFKSTSSLKKTSYLLFLTLPFFIASNIQTENTNWVAPPSADSLINPFHDISEQYSAGKKLFEKVCWPCHNLNGEGNGPAAINLKTKPKNLTSPSVQGQSDGVLFWKITNGRSDMESYRQMFTQKQRWQLVCYLRTLKK